MTHNDLKKGMKVQLTSVPMISGAYRRATIMDNLKGITRMVRVEEENGYFPDIGSVYVNEILFALYDNDMPEPIDVSEAHQKKIDILTKLHWG
tara:strand:+ start:412 stop:690 length:279 start_codon:yes stop_codon:yes gene_type:complete